MRKFRSYLSLLLVAASIHYASAPYNYLYALEVGRAKEQRVREIAAKLNVDPEFLLNPQGRKRFDFKGVFESIEKALGFKSAQVATSDQPLDIKQSIAKVKSRYALVAADTTLAKIAEALEVDLAKTKNKGQLKAHLNSVLRLIDKDFLPEVPEGVSGTAKSRDNQMRQAINKLRKDVKDVLREKDALEEQNLEATLARLRSAVAGELTTSKRGPRWTKDPFPVKDAYKEAPKRQLGSGERPTSNPISAVVTDTAAAKLKQTTNAITVPAEVSALAAQLATPARIFAWVHDNIEFEPYSGVAKGSLGTLQERSGNDWDQAVLLRDMLHSRGFTAQLEWGTVTLPMSRAMNIAGTEDPTQAANLFATAGFDGIVLTSGNIPVGVQLSHAWVRSHIPYIPNRGATAGPADTWVRMDPSFKRYEYQAGIKINGRVAWNENEYLNTSAIRPPADFYGDKIWSYIRANNIDCVNLSQVTKAGRIKQQNFPYVPSTLTSKIDSVGGTSVDVPADQMQSVSITIARGASTVATYNTSVAATWGKKLSISFVPASPDDAATIAAYGGLFNTPAYLIDLKPVFLVDDQPAGEGSPVPAGAELDLNLRFIQPNVAPDTAHHNMVAGETHTLVLDAGNPPDSLIESRMNRLRTLTNEEQLLSEKLYLVGLRYMQHVDDGIDFAAGVRWQRPVKRVFEADIKRQINVSYNFAGAPLRLIPAENNIDVARLVVGIVPIDNDLSNRAEALALAGLESSYREGSIWEEMHSRQGISAAKALLLARISGQQIQTVTASNVDAVLASANLSADVEEEIRGAVGQGRIAKIAPQNVSLGGWTGTGYILQDPATGAATYPISGGLAGGAMTAAATALIAEVFGSEPWLEDEPWAWLLREWLMAQAEAYPTGLSTTVSDPVNITTGNMYRTFSDTAVIARGLPAGVTRTYNSRSSRIGEFGYGWTFNYGARLEPFAGGMTYVESDGTEHAYAENGDGTFTAPPGRTMVLTRETGGFALAYPDNVGVRFNSAGLLTEQRDSNGNVLAINRDSAGTPLSIVDATGRTVLTITTTSGRITKIQDVAGRTTQYAYNGDDLISVTASDGRSWQYSYDLGHNLTQMVGSGGVTNSFDYDSDDRMFHHTDANGVDEYIYYDIAARNCVFVDKRQGESLIAFDANGRATLAADPAGNVFRAEWDANNNRTSMTDSRGNVARYEYDALGNLVKEIRPDATVTSTFDVGGRKLTETDERGLTTNFTYDSNGNLLQVSRTIGGREEKRSFQYDQYGRKTHSTDPNGHASRVEWNDNGSMGAIIDASGRRTELQSDVLGQVTKVTGPTGLQTNLVYDPQGRLTSLTDPYGNTVTLTFDAAGRKTAMTTARGTTRYTYDAEGRLLTTTDVLGNVTTATYDPAGALLSVRDARGNVMRYVYDAAGRLIKSIGPDGSEWQYAYCASVGSGAPACSSCGSSGGGGKEEQFCDITNPSGGKIHREFDSMGRVVAVTDSLGHSMFTQYDSAGRVTMQTDAMGNSVRYGYDEVGRLLALTDATGGVTTYAYDLNGNRIKKTNARGQSWMYKYDVLNRLAEQSDPLERKTTFTYDSLGNLATRTDGKGQTIQFAYDRTRLTSMTYPNGTKDEYTYDTFGRQTSIKNTNVTLAMTYDAMDRLKSLTNQTYNIGVQYEYDAAGNRSKMITPRSTATYTYDAANRLSTVSDNLFGTFRFGYDAVGRRGTLQYPNGAVTAYQYDAGSRLTSVGTTAPAGLIDLWAYSYDAVGNRLSRADVSGAADSFRYDAAGRLTEANYASGAFEKFGYDKVGNRLSSTSQNGETTYSYDIANQLLSAGSTVFTYDANGNAVTKAAPNGTTTFTYDTNNRITKIVAPEGTETNLYGGDGSRVDLAGTPIENGQVRVLSDGDSNPIMDWGTDNQTWTYRLYAPGVDELLGEYRRTNNRITYMHHDALGSVTAVTDTTGKLLYRQNYAAFGAMSRTSDGTGIPPTRIGFTGREQSIGSMMYFRARHYATDTGRFMQPDPIQSTMGSLYAYAENSPTIYTDPTGLYCVNPSASGKLDGIGPNLTKGNAELGVPQTVSLQHPGLCWYQKDFALNLYLDSEGSKYWLPNWGWGYLWPFHYNFKKIPWVVGSGKFKVGGYTFSSAQERFNVHMGYWTNSKVICYIIDDNKRDSPEWTGLQFAFCADWRILGITAAVIVAIVVVWAILGAVGVIGAGAGAGAGLAPVMQFAPKIIEAAEQLARRAA